MKIKAWLVTFVVLFIVLFSLYTFKFGFIFSEKKEAPPAFEPAATVEAIETSIQPFQNTTKVTGIIKAPQQLVLTNELAGKVTGLLFSSGEVVNEEQVLLKLDTSNEVATLKAAKARLTLSEQTLKRYKKLIIKNEISADLVDQASSERDVAISEIEVLNTIIDKKIIKAPFKSVVGLHNLTIGQYLGVNTKITELVGVSDTLWVEFSLPQSFPELAIDEIVTLHASINDNISATIIAVSPVLSNESRHLQYRAKFNKADGLIKPNTLVDVIAPIGKEEGRISVPDLALTHDQFGDYVFVLTPEESGQGSYRAKRTQVWLAQKNNNTVTLKEGVTAKQLIATKGAFKLRDGMKVYIAQAISE